MYHNLHLPRQYGWNINQCCRYYCTYNDSLILKAIVSRISRSVCQRAPWSQESSHQGRTFSVCLGQLVTEVNVRTETCSHSVVETIHSMLGMHLWYDFCHSMWYVALPTDSGFTLPICATVITTLSSISFGLITSPQVFGEWWYRQTLKFVRTITNITF